MTKKAQDYAKKYLSGIARRGGESYAEHCSEVSAVLSEASEDKHMLSVALLHDLLVHPDGRELLERAPLNDHQRSLIEKMHALRRLHIDENTKDLDTVMDAFMEEPELLPLRMAHRVNDIRHLDRFDKKLRLTIAHETLHMYSAIAGRLGMNAWREEMEDASFPLVRPQIARSLIKKFESAEKLDQLCLNHTSYFLEDKIKKQVKEYRIKKRRKGLYSSYRKMVLKNRRFNELTDRLALRVVVPSVLDCYQVLGIIHAHLHPIPGKLKDYIGAPKENGYQSIHTVVYPLPGVTEQPIEIQIRTDDMHKQCAYGAASHGDYKESVYALSSQPARVNLFRNLQTLRQEARNPKQFEEALRNYFREDHIAVFDTDNNLFHLHKPATALDFVCHAFPKKSHRLKAIKVNGRKRPLEYPLHDGDTVEPAFGREKRSKSDWVEACFHKTAKQVIKESLKKDKAFA